MSAIRKMRIVLLACMLLAGWLPSTGQQHGTAVEAVVTEALVQYDATADKDLLRQARARVDSLAALQAAPSKVASGFDRICALQLSPNTRTLKKTNYWRFTDTEVETGFDAMRGMLENAVSVNFNEFVENRDYGHWYLETLVDLYFDATTPALTDALAASIVSFLKGDVGHERLAPLLRQRSRQQALQLVEACRRVNQASEVPYKSVNIWLTFDEIDTELRSGNLVRAQSLYNSIAAEPAIFYGSNLLETQTQLQYASASFDAATLDSFNAAIHRSFEFGPDHQFQKSLRQIESESANRHEAYDLIFSYLARSAGSGIYGMTPYLAAVYAKQQTQQAVARLNHIVFNSMDSTAIADFTLAKQLTLQAAQATTVDDRYALLHHADSLECEAFRRLQWQLSPVDQTPIRPRLTTEAQKQAFDRIQHISNSPIIVNDELFNNLQEQNALWDTLMSELGLPQRNTCPNPLAERLARRRLAPGVAAVEFVCYHQFNCVSTDSVRYLAVVLDERQHPTVVLLPRLDDLALRTDDSSTYQSTSLYEAVWQPVLDALPHDITTIYYSPAGALSLIAHHALPTTGGQLLTDRYDLRLVTSTADVGPRHPFADNAPASRAGEAVLCGNVDYNTAPAASDEAGPLFAFQYRSPTPAAGERYGLTPLDYSRFEIENIAQILSEGRITPIVRDRLDASEQAIRSLSGNAPAILHISTHGFYNPQPASVDPMQRCGLLLSGASRAWASGKSIPGHDDGILTAAEIATLDLSQCRMVVLSACESGLGQPDGYEGVVGLQHAFKLAGVRTIVMSLWRVRDDVTALLMTRFYHHLLTGHTTPHDAMQSAQRDLRHDFPDPHLWAAFAVLD